MKKIISTGASVSQRMAALTASAETNMSNYMGEMIQGKENFISGHSNMSGNANGVTHKPRMKPIIIDLVNTDENNALFAPIFSEFEQLAIPFNGVADIKGTVATAAKGISIVPKDYQLAELKKLTSTRPFTVAKLRYKFGDATQLDSEFILRQKVGSSVAQDPYYPAIARDTKDQVSDILVDEDFFMKVDGGSTLLVKVAPAINSTTPRKVQLVLYVDSETDISSALAGQAVVNTYAAGK